MFNKTICINMLISVTTALVFMSLYAYITATEDGSGHPTESPARAFFQDSRMQSTINQLQESIDTVMQNQQQLVQRNQEFQQKLAQLEDNRANQTAAHTKEHDIDTLVDKADMNMMLEDTDPHTETAAEDPFESIKEAVLQESYDTAWASEMDVALAAMEQRLQTLKLGHTAIASHDCRSSGCLVEFTHDGEIDTSILASLLAVQGTREVVLKQVQDGDRQRTVAIYKR